ncbi:hypothetical protein ABZY90_19690 [Streptomyces sp. NPDC006422]|uniref:hypothetical protein n=1 Tax=unclassified Streptomyces TaxID=2593676 RepID=UPI0033B0301B
MTADVDAILTPWPSQLLPVLTLDDTHELMDLLADVRAGREPDREFAACLLANIAARVPSRE